MGGGGEETGKVLLIGWTGHLPRHLQKYGDVYAALGFHPILYSKHSWHLIFTNPERERVYGQEVIDIIDQEQPVGVHVISNGGAAVWSEALRIGMERSTAASSPFPSVQRVVIDSAPSRFYLADFPAGFRFLWAMAGLGPRPRRIAARAALLLAAVPLFVTCVLYYALALKFLPSRNPTTPYWDRLLRGAAALQASSDHTCPHLLLFSTDDQLVRARNVRRFGEALRVAKVAADDDGGRPAVQVTMHEWRQGEHAGHLRRHKEEYVQLIRTFMPVAPDRDSAVDKFA